MWYNRGSIHTHTHTRTHSLKCNPRISHTTPLLFVTWQECVSECVRGKVLLPRSVCVVCWLDGRLGGWVGGEMCCVWVGGKEQTPYPVCMYPSPSYSPLPPCSFYMWCSWFPSPPRLPLQAFPVFLHHHCHHNQHYYYNHHISHYYYYNHHCHITTITTNHHHCHHHVPQSCVFSLGWCFVLTLLYRNEVGYFPLWPYSIWWRKHTTHFWHDFGTTWMNPTRDLIRHIILTKLTQCYTIIIILGEPISLALLFNDVIRLTLCILRYGHQISLHFMLLMQLMLFDISHGNLKRWNLMLSLIMLTLACYSRSPFLLCCNSVTLHWARDLT